MIGIDFIRSKFFRIRFQNGFQFSLFFLIRRKKIIKTLFRNLFKRIRFIQLLNQHIQFLTAFLRLADSGFRFFCRLCLLQFRRFPNFARKLNLIRKGIVADGLNGFQNQFPECFCGNLMGNAHARFPFSGQHIGRAVVGIAFEYALRIFRSMPMVIQPLPALCAVNQTRQRIRRAQRICTLFTFQCTLGKLPCFLRYNGFMGILEDQQLFRRVGVSLILVIPFAGTKINRMSQILLMGQNSADCQTVPIMCMSFFCIVAAHPAGMFRKVVAGIVHLFFRQNPRDFRRSVSLASHLIDSADSRRRFIVNQPVMLDVRVFSIAV